MTSVQRKYAQRNNNLIKIVPRYETSIGAEEPAEGPGFSMNDIPVYTLSLPTVQYTGGTFYVDLAENDTAGNSIRRTGEFRTVNDNEFYLPMVLFTLEVPFNPAHAPGLDFTIFFKNTISEGTPIASVGLISLDENFFMGDVPIPQIVSPPFPQFTGFDVSNSVTFKSDGTKYNVVSSGPAGWMGVFALASLLTQFGADLP
jgi:hypothetical protein